TVIDKLLDDGVNVNAANSEGVTPLLVAAMMGRLEVVRKLIRLGANPNGGPTGADRPLHRAAMMGHAAVVKLLLDHGADPNAQGSHGLTPLLALAQEGGRMPIGNPSALLDCTRALLAAGADASALCAGRNACEIADQRGNARLAALLRVH